jgi:hypothetical protein
LGIISGIFGIRLIMPQAVLFKINSFLKIISIETPHGANSIILFTPHQKATDDKPLDEW